MCHGCLKAGLDGFPQMQGQGVGNVMEICERICAGERFGKANPEQMIWVLLLVEPVVGSDTKLPLHETLCNN